ncbi:MAG: putative toxin-antitoxin system toxin component, PIN family [Anaerolineales bacterium]|nr:MAG: putative toxin-antitoxin system toxin component, PIN family [Anaerolineales bacterium]
MITVVLDTNVLISSLLSRKSSPAKILDLILENQILVAYDDRILGEYEEVLSRSELHIPPPRMLAVIDHIELNGKHIEPATLPTYGYTDPDDIMFAEVFITSSADALVTGNLRHYKPLLEQEALVLTPAQFLAKFFPERA